MPLSVEKKGQWFTAGTKGGRTVVVVKGDDGKERLLSRQIDVNRSGQVPRRLKLNQVGVGLQENHHNTKESTVQFEDTNNNKKK